MNCEVNWHLPPTCSYCRALPAVVVVAMPLPPAPPSLSLSFLSLFLACCRCFLAFLTALFCSCNSVLSDSGLITERPLPGRQCRVNHAPSSLSWAFDSRMVACGVGSGSQRLVDSWRPLLLYLVSTEYQSFGVRWLTEHELHRRFFRLGLWWDCYWSKG